MDVKEKRILEEVEKLEGDILNFAARLVAQPSTRENEKSALWVMENELAKLSLDPVRVPIDPEVLKDHPGFAPVPWSYEGRYNVVAVREASGTGGKSALFNGHLDVVSPEPISRWDRHPFDPAIEDGWMYGRGAGDMKAGVAAMTYAFHAVEKAGFGFNAPVTLEAVIEEECTGKRGPGLCRCRIRRGRGFDPRTPGRGHLHGPDRRALVQGDAERRAEPRPVHRIGRERHRKMLYRHLGPEETRRGVERGTSTRPTRK